MSQLSIRISLSKDSLRRADDPESPNDIDFLRFPLDPEVGDPKKNGSVRREDVCAGRGSLALAG